MLSKQSIKLLAACSRIRAIVNNPKSTPESACIPLLAAGDALRSVSCHYAVTAAGARLVAQASSHLTAAVANVVHDCPDVNIAAYETRNIAECYAAYTEPPRTEDEEEDASEETRD